MHKGKLVAGVVAGGLLGLTAMALTSHGSRMMIAKKAKMHGKKLVRVAKHFLPL